MRRFRSGGLEEGIEERGRQISLRPVVPADRSTFFLYGHAFMMARGLTTTQPSFVPLDSDSS